MPVKVKKSETYEIVLDPSDHKTIVFRGTKGLAFCEMIIQDDNNNNGPDAASVEDIVMQVKVEDIVEVARNLQHLNLVAR